MSKLPIRKEFSWNKIGSWRHCNPYTISFVYPRGKAGFIVKGGRRDVKEWLKENMLNVSYVEHQTYFCSSRTSAILFQYPVEKSRFNINVHLMNDEVEGSISHNLKRVKGKDPDCPLYGTHYVDDGYVIKVHKKNVGSRWSRDYIQGEALLEKKVKRPPRCFPKQFLPFCDDHQQYLNRKPFLEQGIIKEVE